MAEEISIVLISLIAAIIIMIIHEFTKAVAYTIYLHSNKEKTDIKGIFKLWRYIDPIALVFAANNYGIFSRQYPFVIKSRKAVIAVAITGYISMILMALLCGVIYRVNFHYDIVTYGYEHLSTVGEYTAIFLEFMTYHAFMMFIVNLFPIHSFDMSMISAVYFPKVYVMANKYDNIFKVLFLLLLIWGAFSSFCMILSISIL